MPRKKKDFSKKVMERIEKEEVKMRPKAYFVLGSVLLGTGLAIALLLAAMFTNFVFFRLRMHAPLSYLRLGTLGLKPFLANLPIVPLLISLLSIIAGLKLIKKYDISYKKSFTGIVIGIVTFSLVLGFVIDRIGLNERLGKVRPFQPLVHQRLPKDGWVMGEVIEVYNQALLLLTPEGREVKVQWGEETKISDTEKLSIGTRVHAIGKWDEDTFIAKGIVVGKHHQPGNVKGLMFQKGRRLR